MRKYPGNHTPAQLTVVVDCRNKVAALQSLPPVELERLEELLERQLSWK
jgi:hypothetical protein